MWIGSSGTHRTEHSEGRRNVNTVDPRQVAQWASKRLSGQNGAGIFTILERRAGERACSIGQGRRMRHVTYTDRKLSCAKPRWKAAGLRPMGGMFNIGHNELFFGPIDVVRIIINCAEDIGLKKYCEY